MIRVMPSFNSFDGALAIVSTLLTAAVSTCTSEKCTKQKMKYIHVSLQCQYVEKDMFWLLTLIFGVR